MYNEYVEMMSRDGRRLFVQLFLSFPFLCILIFFLFFCAKVFEDANSLQYVVF